MLRNTIIILFICLGFSGVCAEPSAAIHIRDNAGRLRVGMKPEGGLVFGRVSSGEKKTGSIRVENKTSFKIETGGWRSPCDCLEVGEPEGELDPGKICEIRVILDGAGYSGKFEKNIHISFSASGTESVDIFLPVTFEADSLSDEKSERLSDEKNVHFSQWKYAGTSENQNKADQGTVFQEGTTGDRLAIEQVEIGAEDFDSGDSRTVFVFAGRNCPGCNHIRKILAPKLLEKYGVRGETVSDPYFSLRSSGTSPESAFASELRRDMSDTVKTGRVALLDLEISENMLFLANLEEKLGTKGTKTPVVYFRGMMLYGQEEIFRFSETADSRFSVQKEQPEGWTPTETSTQKGQPSPAVAERTMGDRKGWTPTETSEEAVRRKAGKMTIGVIAVAGLVDGLNPCVFAGLVFLASLLVSARMGGGRLLLAGGAYCLGSFVCYFLLGLGVLGILNSFAGGGGLPRTALNWGMSAVLCVLSFLSFGDAVSLRRSGNGSGMSLKLPDSFRARIRSLMHAGGRGKILLAGAFLAGFAVTVIESACTGQIYVPVLAYLVKTEGAFSAWCGYLLLYNLMFILPLLGLLAAVYFGMNSIQLAMMSRLDAFAGKILMGALFLVLAVLMVVV